MKSHVLITRPVSPAAIELLTSVCATLPRVEINRMNDSDFRLVADYVDAILLGTPERVDAEVLRQFPRLRVIACTFRMPEHIDVAACTRRDVWVTTAATQWLGKDAEIEAARNILDVISGDVPRGALNTVLEFAA